MSQTSVVGIYQTNFLSRTIHRILLSSVCLITPMLAMATEQPLIAEIRQIDIGTDSLDQVLAQFAGLSGVQLSYDPALVQGKISKGLKGQYHFEQGMHELLKGAGLKLAKRADGVWTIEQNKNQARDMGQLKTIDVKAQGSVNLDANAVQLPVITVTAEDSYTVKSDNSGTGMNLSLKDTPQSVSVITKKRMEDQQLNNLNDVLRNMTGVTVFSQEGNTGYAAIYSRGYEIKNIQIDGAMSSSNHNYMNGNEAMDSAIYDSVSVVRGATGLMTGAGDPSGSINLVRKKPTKDFQASLEAQAGRYDKYRGVADIGGGFNEDGSIRGRFIALHNQGGHFNPLLDNQNSTLYGVLEADLGDSTTISGTWERAEAENNGVWEGTSAIRFFKDANWNTIGVSNFNKYTWGASDWTKIETTKDTYTLALNHHINDSWKIDTTYNYKEYDNKKKYGICYNFDGSNCVIDSVNNIKEKNKAHSLDVKLNGTFELFGQTHDLVAGFNGQKIKNNEITLNKSNTSPQDIIMVNNRLVFPEPTWGGISSTNNTEIQQYGGFISTKLNFTDDLSAILGGRYSEWETKTINNINNKVTDDRKFDNFLPYLALTYDLTENLTTYVSYTEIFNPQNRKDRNGDYLDPETGFNYEVGLKGEWFDGRLNSSIALFQSGKDNLAVLEKDANGNSILTPTGGWAWKAEDDTKNKGWEFEVAGEITPYWHAQFGFSSSILKDKDGQRINGTSIPIRTANLFTTYQATPSLTVGGGLRWQSETSNNGTKNTYIKLGREDLVGEATQKDYYVVDLMANYEFNKNLSLLVNINNALNKEYKNSNAFAAYSYGEERNWMATLKYKF